MPARSVPPSLHWSIVLVLAIVTGVFQLIWAFVQSAWVRTIDPNSRATRDYMLAIVLLFAAPVLFVLSAVAMGVFDNPESDFPLGRAFAACLLLLLLFAASAFFHVRAIFSVKNSLERYYNTVEPIQLRLSSLMALFFNVVYFQYHFSRIASWKRTGILRPQRPGIQTKG